MGHKHREDISMMFGCHSVRAVSKITASIVQITLEVKSENAVDQYFQMVSLLAGENE